MTDESSNQITNVLLTPPNDSNITHKTQIFLYIKYNYEHRVLLEARKLEKFALREASTREQLRFLHKCRRARILPQSARSRPIVRSPFGYQMAEKNGGTMSASSSPTPTPGFVTTNINNGVFDSTAKQHLHSNNSVS